MVCSKILTPRTPFALSAKRPIPAVQTKLPRSRNQPFRVFCSKAKAGGQWKVGFGQVIYKRRQ